LFHEYPETFYKFAKLLYPANIDKLSPSTAHTTLAKPPGANQKLKIYTQNIDSLHQQAGSKGVVEVHGSLRALRCDSCRFTQTLSPGLIAEIHKGAIPKCPDQYCPKRGKGTLRPTITFFNEALAPGVMHDFLTKDRFDANVLLVIGTSLAAKPMSKMPALMPDATPRIWINRDGVDKAMPDSVKDVGWDCSLEGDADIVLQWLWSGVKQEDSPFNASLLPRLSEMDGPRWHIK
jgi:NAD-dependent SIR2 family protein deacetylase